MKLSGRYHDCLSCRHLLSLTSKAHLAITLDDVVHLFLILVVLGNLSPFRLKRHHPHREVLCLNGGCATGDVPGPSSCRELPAIHLVEICYGHSLSPLSLKFTVNSGNVYLQEILSAGNTICNSGIAIAGSRSEERRVGKEWRCRGVVD